MSRQDGIAGQGPTPADTAAGDDLRAMLRSARAQHRTGAGAVLDVLLRGVDDPSTLVASLVSRAGVAVLLDPADAVPDFGTWKASSAKQWRCVVVRARDGQRFIAAEDPWDEATLHRVARVIPGGLPAAAIPRACLESWLTGSDVPMPFANTPRSAAATTEGSGVANSASAGEGPIVAFVDHALKAAFRLGASDVHFECDRSSVTVKHRLDGVMVPFATQTIASIQVATGN